MDEIKGFTAGPWIADGPPDNIHILVEAAPHLRVCFLTSNGPTEANARLISAAPDLLAAIINSDAAHWTTAMRAAIAKATGTEPK